MKLIEEDLFALTLLLIFNFVISKDAPEEVCLYTTAVFTCETETVEGYLCWHDDRNNVRVYSSPLNIDGSSATQLGNGPFYVRLTEVSNGGKNFTATATVENVTLNDNGKYILCGDALRGTMINESIQVNTNDPPAPLNIRCTFSTTNSDGRCTWDPPNSPHCITEYILMKNGSDIKRTQNTAVDIHNIGDYTYNMFTVFGRNILGTNGSISRPFILHKLPPQFKDAFNQFRYNNSTTILIVCWTFVPNIPLPTNQFISQNGNRQVISATSRNQSFSVLENSNYIITISASNGIGDVSTKNLTIFVPVNQSPSPALPAESTDEAVYMRLFIVFFILFVVALVFLPVFTIIFCCKRSKDKSVLYDILMKFILCKILMERKMNSKRNQAVPASSLSNEYSLDIYD